jgi:DNA-directed RNA polymerase subunit RPC12/RpoP
MTHWEAITCPHCGHSSSVEHLRKFKLLEVHPVRKDFDELGDREMEREYYCDRCERAFFGTLLRIATGELKDEPFFLDSDVAQSG